MNNHSSRQCRDSYKSYLAPGLTFVSCTDDDDELLRVKLHKIGPKWAKMKAFFPERSDANLKNRWSVISGLVQPAPVPMSALEFPLSKEGTVSSSPSFRFSLTKTNPTGVTKAPVVPDVLWIPNTSWEPNPDEASNDPRKPNGLGTQNTPDIPKSCE
jgi:hypothetical protein